jgi:hypothetical protein
LKINIKNNIIIIDDEDYDKIKDYTWHINSYKNTKMIYARSSAKDGGVYMHRIIMDIHNRIKIDHINGNGIDNRKENLRIATHQQNNFNKKPYVNNKCGLKGVRLDRGNYVATITYNAVTKYIGSYKIIEEAAMAYDKKALELFGEFAYLNYPERKDEYKRELASKCNLNNL